MLELIVVAIASIAAESWIGTHAVDDLSQFLLGQRERRLLSSC